MLLKKHYYLPTTWSMANSMLGKPNEIYMTKHTKKGVLP